jgi:hypothetical protein
MVGHFKHSSSATSHFHRIQEQLGLPPHKLLQVSQLYNSTMHYVFNYSNFVYALGRVNSLELFLLTYGTLTRAASGIHHLLLRKSESHLSHSVPMVGVRVSRGSSTTI